nr:hypothetical protein [Rhodococcus rhodochrous]
MRDEPLEFDGRVERGHLKGKPHAALGQRQRQRRRRKQIIQTGFDTTVQLIVGDDIGEQADPQGFVGIELPSSEHQFVRAAGTDDPRQQPRRADIATGETNFDERHSEDGTFGGDTHVARGHESKAPTGRRAVDRSDKHLRQSPNLLNEGSDVVLTRQGPMHRTGLLGARHVAVSAEVEPRAEPPPGTREHNDAGRTVRGEHIEFPVQCRNELEIQRVQRVRAVHP